MRKCDLISFDNKVLELLKQMYVTEIDFVQDHYRNETEYVEYLKGEVKQIDEELGERK